MTAKTAKPKAGTRDPKTMTAAEIVEEIGELLKELMSWGPSQQEAAS